MEQRVVAELVAVGGHGAPFVEPFRDGFVRQRQIERGLQSAPLQRGHGDVELRWQRVVVGQAHRGLAAIGPCEVLRMRRCGACEQQQGERSSHRRLRARPQAIASAARPAPATTAMRVNEAENGAVADTLKGSTTAPTSTLRCEKHFSGTLSVAFVPMASFDKRRRDVDAIARRAAIHRQHHRRGRRRVHDDVELQRAIGERDVVEVDRPRAAREHARRRMPCHALGILLRVDLAGGDFDRGLGRREGQRVVERCADGLRRTVRFDLQREGRGRGGVEHRHRGGFTATGDARFVETRNRRRLRVRQAVHRARTAAGSSDRAGSPAQGRASPATRTAGGPGNRSAACRPSMRRARR